MAYFQMPLGFHFNSLIEKMALKWAHPLIETSHSALHRQD